jgi:hypothetical protein
VLILPARASSGIAVAGFHMARPARQQKHNPNGIMRRRNQTKLNTIISAWHKSDTNRAKKRQFACNISRMQEKPGKFNGVRAGCFGVVLRGFAGYCGVSPHFRRKAARRHD